MSKCNGVLPNICQQPAVWSYLTMISSVLGPQGFAHHQPVLQYTHHQDLLHPSVLSALPSTLPPQLPLLLAGPVWHCSPTSHLLNCFVVMYVCCIVVGMYLVVVMSCILLIVFFNILFCQRIRHCISPSK